MNRIQVRYGLVFLCLLFVYGCSSNNDYSPEYRKPTNQEITELIKEKDLVILASKDYENATLVLFESAHKQGYYSISMDNHGKLNQIYGSTIPRGEGSDVTLIHSSTGDPTSFIIFNKSEIPKTADHIILYYQNGGSLTKKTDGQKGLIITNEDNSDLALKCIEVRDREGKLIYKQD